VDFATRKSRLKIYRSGVMESQGRIGVVLADDNPDILLVARSTLGERFHIVAAVDDGEKAVSAVLELDPDVLITDFSMPTLNGLQGANSLQKAGSRAKIVLLTLHEDQELITASLAAGASGYVTKARLSADLVSAVEEVLKGNTFISAKNGRKTARNGSRQLVCEERTRLTKRAADQQRERAHQV
jgi:DNA-binding NarL/FixJ family response regulator